MHGVLCCRCLSPRIECKGIIPEKCNVMSSKKLPLWLCFENADPNGENYLAIFKVRVCFCVVCVSVCLYASVCVDCGLCG